MKNWNSVDDILPGVSVHVMVRSYENEEPYEASLFDIDHSNEIPIVRFLMSNIDKIQFCFPRYWRSLKETK